MKKMKAEGYDPFASDHVEGAVYFLDQGQYLFKYKHRDGSHGERERIVSKVLSAPDVSLAFTRRGFDSGWISDGVIRTGRNQQGPFYVYFKWPGIEKIAFHNGSEQRIELPALLLVCSKRDFFLAALKIWKSSEFTPKTPVFAAPFPNVNSNNGRICWGNNQEPSSDPKRAAEVMKLFFAAPFNGDLADGKSLMFPKDVREVYKILVDEDLEYPLSDLVDLKKTVEQWVDSIIGRD